MPLPMGCTSPPTMLSTPDGTILEILNKSVVE